MKPRHLLLTLALAACSSDPPPPPPRDATVDAAPDVGPDVGPDAAPEAPPPDAPAPVDTAPDAAPDVAPDTAADAPADAAGDLGADVPLRNGCPVLTDPVGAMGDPPMGDTYAAFARDLFGRFCVRCHSTTLVTPEDRHGAPDGLNWDDEASVRRELMRIRRAVGVDNYMPLTPPNPTCEERRRLVRWIDIGAP